MSIRDTVTGVQHVGIPTTDLEGTIAYYERLGFECLGIYPNGEDRCTFLRLNNLTLEVWTMDPTPMEKRCHQPLRAGFHGYRGVLR